MSKCCRNLHLARSATGMFLLCRLVQIWPCSLRVSFATGWQNLDSAMHQFQSLPHMLVLSCRGHGDYANMSIARRQVCCPCIMNASYDYSAALKQIVADAKQYNYSGYALDFECGNAAYDPKHRAKFLTDFGDALHALGPDMTLSFFDHLKWNPAASFPNHADAVRFSDRDGLHHFVKLNGRR